MALTIYNVIKRPVISDKSYKLNSSNKVVFIVNVKATAPMIKEAVEKLFDVKVAKVNTQIRKGKMRRIGKIKIEGTSSKRAYITLAQGHRISLFEHLEQAIAQEQPKMDLGKE